MEQYIIVSLLLLVPVILDALGDSFRIRGWQNLHHTMESAREAFWIGMIVAVSPLLGWLEFEWYYIGMYILGRIWLFDPILNLVSDFDFFYISDSSTDGRILIWLSSDKVFDVPVILPAAMVKFIALVWWVAWLLTDGGIKTIFP